MKKYVRAAIIVIAVLISPVWTWAQSGGLAGDIKSLQLNYSKFKCINRFWQTHNQLLKKNTFLIEREMATKEHQTNKKTKIDKKVCFHALLKFKYFCEFRQVESFESFASIFLLK